jgi:uncharacterized Zn-finger protein
MYLATNKHMRTGEKPYACVFEGCSAAFAESGDLARHKRRHTGEKPFKCVFEGCGAEFAQSHHLANHKRTHTGEKPFKCDFEGCGAAFARSHHLANHERTHTGEKPFKCDFEGCGAAFAESGDLPRHKRRHTGEKPFKCVFEGCDAEFAQSHHLANHERRHTGEKPFKCVFEGCSAAFAESGALANHERTHTGEKPFKCDFEGCGAAFAQSHHLARHKRTHTIEGIARRKKKEQAVERLLISAGYIKSECLGDAAPPPRHFVREKQIDFRCVDASDSKKWARIDFVINVGGGVIVLLEVDEDQHKFGLSARHAFGASYACDAARMCAVMHSMSVETSGASASAAASLRYVWIRYNPDTSRRDGAAQRRGGRIPDVCDRKALLLSALRHSSSRSVLTEAGWVILYINYDVDAGGALAHFGDLDFPDTLREMSKTYDVVDASIDDIVLESDADDEEDSTACVNKTA